MADRFKLGIEPIKDSGNKFLAETLFEKKQKLMYYSKDKLLVGITRDGKPFYLDMSEALRILLLGRTRTGKTFFLRAMLDRLIKSGYCAIIVSDVKNEFYTSTKPVQMKFQHLMLKGEKPTGLSIIALRPTFFKSLVGSEVLPKENVWFSVDINKLTKADFETLLKMQDWTAKQKTSWEIMADELKEKVIQDIDEIMNMVEDLDITPTEIDSLKYKFKPVKVSKFYQSEHVKSVVKAMKNGVVPTLNLEEFQDFGKDALSYPPVMTGIVLRDVIKARRRGLIKPVWVFIDEAPIFVPRDSNPSCKADILQSIKLDTRYNVNYAFASQTLEAIDEGVIKQCRYIFVPYNADIGVFTKVMAFAGIGGTQQNRGNVAMKIRAHMRKFEWMVVDMNDGKYHIISPVGPLSWHAETDN